MTRFKALSFILLFFGLALGSALAQPLRRNHLGSTLQSALQIEYYADSNQVVYAHGMANWASADRERVGSSSWSRWQAGLRYERWFSDRWAVGAGYTSTRTPNDRINEWQGYGVHNGRIGENWILLKSVGLSRLNYGISGQDSDWRASGMAYLGRRIRVGDKPLQLGLRYELAKVWPTLGDSRRISETRLTLQADMPVGNRLMLRAFVQRYTQYFFGLAQDRYNADGELIESVPFHKLNRVSPVYGFQVRYLLRKEQGRGALPFVF